jgi:hypothetical protein
LATVWFLGLGQSAYLTGHLVANNLFAVSMSKWNSLSAAQQKTLQEAADVTDEEDPYFDPEDGVPKEVVTTDVTFKITKRRKITGTELKQMVADFGQRGTSKKLGVPRTTIQDWLKRART